MNVSSGRRFSVVVKLTYGIGPTGGDVIRFILCDKKLDHPSQRDTTEAKA